MLILKALANKDYSERRLERIIKQLRETCLTSMVSISSAVNLMDSDVATDGMEEKVLDGIHRDTFCEPYSRLYNYKTLLELQRSIKVSLCVDFGKPDLLKLKASRQKPLQSLQFARRCPMLRR